MIAIDESVPVSVPQSDSKPHKLAFVGFRHLQIFMLSTCLAIVLGTRVNLSVAIVAMTNRHYANPDFVDFEWNEETKSIILSSYYVGYFITQIPGGLLVKYYGPRIIMLVTMTVASICTLLIPVAATYGDWIALTMLRVLQGMLQGTLFPALHSMISRWAPVVERSQLGSYCYIGSPIGTCAILALGGSLSTSSMGWPGIFYVSGIPGIVWAIVWYFIGANSPSESKLISSAEKQYIESSLGEVNEKKNSTPWMEICKSGAFWALAMSHCAHGFGSSLLITEMPTYLSSVLNFDMSQNGLLSAAPYLAMIILNTGFSSLAVVMLSKKWITLQYSRKIFNTVGQWVPMTLLFGLAYTTPENKYTAVVLLITTVAFTSAAFQGFLCNHIDLAPNHAGTLMSITNTLANLLSLFGPLVVGQIVTDETNTLQWRVVFLITGGAYFLGNCLFLVLGESEKQSWNESSNSKVRY